MRVYFVRHGQSELNKAEKHQFPEVPLSPEGIQQANTVAERFSRIPAEFIFSSDLQRAKQTAEAISEVLKVQIEYSPLLRERAQPTLFRGRSIFDPQLAEIRKQIHANRHNASWHHSDEENFFDVVERVKQFLNILEKRTESEIVVVTHGVFIKTFMAYLMFGEHVTPDQFYAYYSFFWLHNTGVTVIEKRLPEIHSKLSKEPQERWHLLTWNDHAHLKDITE